MYRSQLDIAIKPQRLARASQIVMFALPRKQICAVQTVMSALGSRLNRPTQHNRAASELSDCDMAVHNLSGAPYQQAQRASSNVIGPMTELMLE